MTHVKRKGFTLIELLVVISIISLLSSIVLSSLNAARAKARDAKRRLDLYHMTLALEQYYNSEGNGNYPPLTGYFGNTVQFGGTNPSFNVLIPQYISQLPKDPLYGGYVAGFRADYSYLTKDWATCAGGNPQPQKYAIYAVLELPPAADLATISDSFDQCNRTNWGFNYRAGN